MDARKWTLSEARAVLPRVIDITTDAHERFTALYNLIEETILPEGELEDREEELQAILAAWAAEIQDLGAEIKGLWLVDFDHGSGYYCWKYPEIELLFEHSYEGGFAGRRRIVGGE